MSNLVIVESPAKCKKIASFLGPGYVVLATMGHIRALEEDLDAVGIDRDFEPRFRFLKEKSRATKPILEAAEKATTIFLAADDDREGEAIAYSVACLLKRDPLSLPRSVFHEITETAVKHAIANPRRLDMSKVYAQQARSILDMLVGFTISPLLWKHVARGLSAGRCQTPALRLISDREKDVNNHTMQTSWNISGKIQTGSEFEFDSKMEDELEDQESSLNYLENIHGDSTCIVSKVELKEWTANAPKPLITSSLQQEASALHKINPKSTMKIAQALYEAGHITYMRTDHPALGEEAVLEAQEEVRKRYGVEYVGAQPSKASKPSKDFKKETPKAQEAHEAIRPTHFDLQELPPSEEWSDIDKKIYALIFRRAMQSAMSSARGKTRTITLTMAADIDKFPWLSSWRITDFPGWQILGHTAKLDEDDDKDKDNDNSTSDATHWKKSQNIVKGQILNWKQIQASPKRSRALPRFTEATLIRELEKRGIGRPSTFASLVEVLFDKEYVEKKDISGTKIYNTSLMIEPMQWPPLTQNTQITLGAEKQKVVPTTLGDSVVSFCLREFPQLFAYEFTTQMEQRLDMISKGEEQWKGVCHDTWDSYKGDYARLNDKASLPSASEKVCDFGNGFKAVLSKTGPLIVQEAQQAKGQQAKGQQAKGQEEKGKATFYSFPPGYTMQNITEAIAKEWVEKQIADTNLGTIDGKAIVKKKGPYGDYLQCGESRIPYIESDTIDIIKQKFQTKTQNTSSTYKFGPYTFGSGQYGPYMFKTDLKTKVFISIAATLNPKTLTGAEADALYKSGMEAKKAKGNWRGGHRGGKSS